MIGWPERAFLSRAIYVTTFVSTAVVVSKSPGGCSWPPLRVVSMVAISRGRRDNQRKKKKKKDMLNTESFIIPCKHTAAKIRGYEGPFLPIEF